MNYEEEVAKMEKEFNEREAKEAGKVDKEFQPKDTEEMYREHLIAKAAEDHHQAEVDKIAKMSDEELQAAWNAQEGQDCEDCTEQRKEGIPWFQKTSKSASKTVLKFS